MAWQPGNYPFLPLGAQPHPITPYDPLPSLKLVKVEPGLPDAVKANIHSFLPAHLEWLDDNGIECGIEFTSVEDLYDHPSARTDTADDPNRYGIAPEIKEPLIQEYNFLNSQIFLNTRVYIAYHTGNAALGIPAAGIIGIIYIKIPNEPFFIHTDHTGRQRTFLVGYIGWRCVFSTSEVPVVGTHSAKDILAYESTMTGKRVNIGRFLQKELLKSLYAEINPIRPINGVILWNNAIPSSIDRHLKNNMISVISPMFNDPSPTGDYRGQLVSVKNYGPALGHIGVYKTFGILDQMYDEDDLSHHLFCYYDPEVDTGEVPVWGLTGGKRRKGSKKVRKSRVRRSGTRRQKSRY